MFTAIASITLLLSVSMPMAFGFWSVACKVMDRIDKDFYKNNRY